MKTDDVISFLAANAGPTRRPRAEGRFGLATALGGFAAALMAALIFGIRPDIAGIAGTPLFWAKVAFPAVLAALALCIAARLSRPGLSVGGWWLMLAVPVLVLWTAAAAIVAQAPAPERLSLVMGTSWRDCPFNILLLSVPAFIATCRAMKSLAPTHLRAAGAAAGLLSGATATVAYCLHCPEMSVAFWAIWYVAGMAGPAILGAVFGPRLLAW
ncbi:Protein of uncharacterised function (DUF1109) [Bordetella ansorpii]|uniref:Protein of uncharacterized function (DUF1109) n=1 Tax=Bordetella ansorpii TaxID=288768 RepID=A0A157SAD8_9BORD|nr:DUF1109 domain-containing protein [Bordetella ansorpii]SAI67251.1 Protein of uncharacterised function (DUF1109) [Bordetella ansorpii]